MAAFSLPWYAILGTQKAFAADLPVIVVILIGIAGPTAGRYFIDLTSGVTPQQFTRGEWFVGTAVLAGGSIAVQGGFLGRRKGAIGRGSQTAKDNRSTPPTSMK